MTEDDYNAQWPPKFGKTQTGSARLKVVWISGDGMRELMGDGIAVWKLTDQQSDSIQLNQH
jgi:hypothetical protein